MLSKTFGRIRLLRARRFLEVGSRIADDANEMMSESETPNSSARVLIPLVVDARRKGDRLLASSSRFQQIFAPRLEKNVVLLHKELKALESKLRSLPRSTLTLEDVLAGQFDGHLITEGSHDGEYRISHANH